MTENVIQGKFGDNKATLPDSETRLVDLILDKEAPDKTKTYQIIPVSYVPVDLEEENDLETGGTRRRRWGAQLVVGVIPHLNQSGGNLTLPQIPAMFVDGDTLDDLRNRIMYEVDKAIEIARLSVDNPDLLNSASEKVMGMLGGSVSE